MTPANKKPQLKHHDYLVLDISNLLHRTYFSQHTQDSETSAGLAIHMALTTLNKYYKSCKPKKVVMCFDRGSWRKEYTAKHDFLKPYKGNRRQNMSQADQIKYEAFVQHLKEFEFFINEYTTIVSLACDRLEADDLIAGFVQSHVDSNIAIISADSDLAQLKIHPNVSLISPITDEEQSLSKYNNDPRYYLFHKCIRGDSTDNIQAAYPRVRSTRIEEIHHDNLHLDGFKYNNFMKESWTDQLKRTFTVEDMFNHNKVLIDLSCQPSDIRDLMDATISSGLEAKKKFSYFHTIKFIGKYDLQKIKDSIDNFIPMLSS